MPSIFVKDDLRASVEAATGGRVTVLYTASGQPSFMNIIPKFNLQDIDASLGTGVHPAFIVGGVEKSELFIGQHAGVIKNGELLSLPGVDPSGSKNHDEFVSIVRANGTGWHLMSNAEWAAIALWCWKNGFMPRGNTTYGKSSDAPWETARRVDGGTPGDASGVARTLTGAGPVSWRHDNTATGISDLCGNVIEWAVGMRIVAGEIQVIANNDAALSATDLSATSSAWKAIDATTGALITPTFTGTIAGGDYTPTTVNSVRYATSGTANNTLVRASSSSFEGMTNPGGTPVALAALVVLKQLGLYPVAPAGLGGDGFWIDMAGERVPIRGGSFLHHTQGGVFALNLTVPRSGIYVSVGARPAYVI